MPIDAALTDTLPRAVDHLATSADSADHIAELVESGLSEDARDLLGAFGIRVGARRLADASTSLARLGLERAAAVAPAQARIVGGLQHPLARGDDATLAREIRRLGPGYARLREALVRDL